MAGAAIISSRSSARFGYHLLALLLIAISAASSSSALEVREVDLSAESRPSLSAGSLPEIAIIGAGAGGAFTAHYLRELLGPRAAITVVEANKVGGRVEKLSYGGKDYELGASIIYSGNYYVVNATDRLGLQRQEVDAGLDVGANLLSLWNGRSFVFSESSFSVWSLVKALYRWGTAPIRFKRFPEAFFQNFVKIYHYQHEGVAFVNPQDMLRAMGCYKATQQAFTDFVREAIGDGPSSKRYESEFLEAVNRVNYGQTNDRMNAFAGLVSAIAAMDGDSSLFQIKGGNSALCEAMLEDSGVKRVQGRISRVERLPDGTFTLSLTEGAGGDGGEGAAVDERKLGPFGGVVIAAPLETARGLKLSGPGMQLGQRAAAEARAGGSRGRQFQRTHTTYVAGRLDPRRFGVGSLPEGLGHIFVTKESEEPFNSISAKGPAFLPADEDRAGEAAGGEAAGGEAAGGAGTQGGNATMYKVFSPERLTDEQLSELFGGGGYEVVARRDWAAYPKYSPPERFSPFLLAPGLAYGNAIDNAASAIEMSAIAARNSALLIHQHLNGKAAAPPASTGGSRGTDQQQQKEKKRQGGLEARVQVSMDGRHRGNDEL